MSNSKKPGSPGMGRVRRGPGPKKKLNRYNYRDRALPFLREDFQDRCAYSMQHQLRVGLRSMEVDHFNPKLPQNQRHRYQNLFLATRHCNNMKGANWPTVALQKSDVRFLNC